jgi:hypothetical protein
MMNGNKLHFAKQIRGIITNPPFDDLAELFIRHAIKLMEPVNGKVIMFLRNEFDCGKTRRGLFNGNNPKFPFAHKIVVTKRPRWIEGSKGSPRHSYAWFVWDFAHQGGAYVSYVHPDDCPTLRSKVRQFPMSESFRDEVKKFGGIRPAARELGIPESSLRYKLDKEAKEERRASLRATSLPAAVRFPVPEEGVSYFILTSAQDCTKIHEDFFANLLAYRAWLQTEFDAPCNLMVGGFTYNKKLFEEHDPSIRSDKVWFDERLDPYIIHERVDIGDKLPSAAR